VGWGLRIKIMDVSFSKEEDSYITCCYTDIGWE
jgi:hypothetical protein